MKLPEPDSLIVFFIGIVLIIISLWGLWDYLPFGLSSYDWQAKSTLIWKVTFVSGLLLIIVVISDWRRK